jgi:hypothetical protein
MFLRLFSCLRQFGKPTAQFVSISFIVRQAGGMRFFFPPPPVEFAAGAAPPWSVIDGGRDAQRAQLF